MTDGFDPLVLVAEDDADLRTLLRYRLEQSGFRVVAAATGADAVALAAEHHPTRSCSTSACRTPTATRSAGACWRPRSRLRR
ncbi:MAG: hypothetical protein H0V45_10660 [Actinobacteria bacterium]|nr:hypothetical protein [Actinomycetota bacterium]